MSKTKLALLRKRLQGKGKAPTKRAVIPRHPYSGPAPLSFAQERLWFLEQLQPDTPAFNLPFALQIQGPLNIDRLKQSLNYVVQRHETLRTTFTNTDQGARQVVLTELVVDIPVIDLNIYTGTALTDQIEHHIAQDADMPFDIAQVPLFRLTLLHLAPNDYIAVFNMHHIISDGWSVTLFIQELSHFYACLSTDPTPNLEQGDDLLPELPIQYRDFAVWQREWLRGETLAEQFNYWKKQLYKAPPIQTLPTSKPRPKRQTFNSAKHPVRVAPDLSRAAKALGRQSGVTLFMVLLAAFKGLLARYVGQTDIVVGTPIANRNRVEVESLIGFMLNTLVLRTDLAGNPTFKELLGRVREVSLGAFSHQDLPFEKLVEELSPERHLNYTPLFQIMFNFHNNPQSDLVLPGLTVKPFAGRGEAEKFDLTLSLYEDKVGIGGHISYNTDLFEAEFISRLGAHYQIFLARAVRQPHIPLSQLSLLTEDEQRQILIDWNNTTAAYPQITIPQVFESRAEKRPTKYALIFAGNALTFTELNRRANQVAHYLKKQGIGRGNFVAICLERSAEMVVALLGVLKAGAAYLPLDPAYPPDRLHFMLSETQPALLISQSILASSFTDHTQPTLCLDLAQADLAQEDQTNLQIDIKADDIVYVMYTSGSTGRPKGVLGLHRGAINRFHWMWQKYPFADDDVCCQKTALGFVDSVWEIFGPLLQGKPLVIIPDEVLKDTKRFIQTLANYHVSRIVLVPSLLRVMLNLIPDLQQQLPSLKFWVTSGETLPVELAHQFAEAMPASTLVNLYGSSEVSADATWHQIRTGQSLTSVPIGRPIANTQIYLLDKHLQPVPIGVPGELYISGDGLARGYLNRPELTEKAFISDPFCYQPDSRLYKTGDLGRWLSDGNIEYIGRVDHQVKIRGFRIELGEVETVLSQHPNVSEAAVTAREDLPDEKRLVAYFVSSRKKIPTITELRRYLKQKLPNYMIPSAFVLVDALTLLPSGKVDRRALPAPDKVWQEPSDSSVKPRDELELQLTKIWEKGLGIKNVGIKDNFFDLGGHSLLAVRLFAQIQKIFGKDLPLTTLFQAPTVEQLADVLRQEGWSSPWSSLVPIQHSGSKPPFFCVHGCGGIVFHMQGFARHLFPEQPLYGLKAQGLEKGQTPHSRIEDMAAFYIKEIQTVQPDGPYYIGGTGYGGAVVLEIAQQLKSQGQNVVFLALINAVPLKPYSSNVSFIRGIYGGSFKYFFNRLVDFMRNRPLLPYVKYTIFNRVLVNWNISRRFVPMNIQREYRFREAFTNAILNYTAHGYPGRITCIICEKFSGNPQSRVRDWYDIAGGELDVRFVPGTIEEIWRGREPYVRILAEQLKECLEEAQTNSEGFIDTKN